MDEPTIELADRTEIFDLRRSMLRPHLPPEASVYPEEGHPDTFHLAARDPGTGAVIGCATFFPQPLDGEPGWRFRGMATVADLRGRGIGAGVLRRGVAEVARRGGRLVWCNGRTGAAGFYERNGFTRRGAQFDVPPLGPHYLFVRYLPSGPPPAPVPGT
ncbi:MAG TPA: GNAT family N-acetyltransferase [Actinomycetes bacterium]|nr:GNAT family N-acetyltransferase [Actinomycetes bacterium]